VDVCAGPLIVYDVTGSFGDVNARRLAECERCGEIMVVADSLDARHQAAPLIEDKRRVDQG